MSFVPLSINWSAVGAGVLVTLYALPSSRAASLWWTAAAVVYATVTSPFILAATYVSPAHVSTVVVAIAASFAALLLSSFVPRRRVASSRSKCVVVSGCDSGFGADVSAKLAAEGFTVFAGCLTKEGIARCSATAGIVAIELDVTNEQAVNALVRRVSEWLDADTSRALHAVVNNAGIGLSSVVDWMPLESYKKTMDVNFFGHVCVTKAFLPRLYSAGVTARRSGTAPPRVVNITSIAGILGAPGLSAYCASKYALEAFSDALRRESSVFGLSVAIIEPSFLKTPILDDAEKRVRETFDALPADTRARWGEPYAASSAKYAARIKAKAESSSLGTAAIFAAVADFSPRARYRAGTEGVYLLPYIAALPAFVADAILAAAGPRQVPALARS